MRTKGWLGKLVIYVENPEKTEQPKTAGVENYFSEEKEKMSEQDTQSLSDVIAYAVNAEKTEQEKSASDISDEKEEIMQQYVSGVNLFKATTPKGSQSNDPFWDTAASMLLMALMFYLLYEAPKDEQNFPMVMELLRAGEVKEDDEEYQSPLDELFERLEMKNPEHIALKYYKDYHSGSAKTLKSIQITLAARLEKFNLSSLAAMTATDELELAQMQSSQGACSKCAKAHSKYPHKANAITDPEYSIECGVQELKSCLVAAKAKNPMDIDHIKLALQGYNYGNGYIAWAEENYGGYTLANAAEFSEKMAKEKHLKSYGDKQYVPHVLRYYSFGRIPLGIGNGAIVQVALTQEGNGGTTYWSWYGFQNRVSWCACFVSWCADRCGYIESGVIPKFSLCSDGVKQFQKKKQFKDGSYVPAAGDIIFFDWKNDGTIDHVGIVESVTKGTVNTVEGNSSDKVKRHSYPLGDSRIYGYGVPAY